jgi:hypothetical protein
LFSLFAIFIIGLLCAIPYGLYKTRYVICNGRLSSRSIFASMDIGKKDIAAVELTRIPFMLRGYGAGLYSLRAFIPGVGWTRVIMTNLTDGVLIKTKGGANYLITPSNPRAFVKLLK